MRIDVVTLFPEGFRASLGFGVVGRAAGQGRLSLVCWNPRAFAPDARGTVDGRPFGGGPGMVMLVGPLVRCLQAARSDDPRPVRVSALSPQGRPLDHAGVAELAQRERLLLVCGRYEGIDERVTTGWVDEEWSTGDYVLSGGELAAAALVDAVARQLPGVLGKVASAEEDSFADGLLDHPHFARPETCAAGSVPPVLRSGHHGAVRAWRRRQRLARTWLRRPDLLADRRLDADERQALAVEIENYMAAPDGVAATKRR